MKHECSKEHPCDQCKDLDAMWKATHEAPKKKERLPDLSKHKDILRNLKTPICGARKVCSLWNEDCSFRCVRQESEITK